MPANRSSFEFVLLVSSMLTQRRVSLVSQHQPISEERFFVLDTQKIELQKIASSGYLLDIGGGGEGTIGRLVGEQVIAIDIRKEELQEAPSGPLKILMDARSLQFLDESFFIATAFFTMMYISRDDHKQVLQEIYRVLRPGGVLMIWDAIIPRRRHGDKKDIFVVPLQIQLPDEEIQTKFGILWKDQGQDLPYFLEIAGEVGFKVVSKELTKQHFFLELHK
ncbi:MAG: class I SAM-dependent methyltransferase [Candidatus Heimdallarchaeota archaeon]